MEIRAERLQDIGGVRSVNRAAFPTTEESDLVDTLRSAGTAVVSLVADDGGSILGHILFSPVTLLNHPDIQIAGLAPMAVLPANQRNGIGSALVRAGLEACGQFGYAAVVVLGHPGYYPRFGFVPASRLGIGSEYEVPDEVFMALELTSGSLSGKSGTVRYHPAFGMA